MLLFWRGTTRQGITTAITVGLLSSLTWLMLSGPAFQNVYGMKTHQGLVPFSQPGIVTIPLGFVVLVVVSLLTRRAGDAATAVAGATPLASVPGSSAEGH
jgi:cation/acetate symporter